MVALEDEETDQLVTMNDLASKPELLRNLKGTAEGLLAIGTSYNVWNTSGGWDRIQMSLQNIMTHHLLLRENFWQNGFWPVIESATAQGYLNPPSFDVSDGCVESCKSSSNMSISIGMQKCRRWLGEALHERRITCLLRQLTSHPDFLAEFYEPDAFLLDSTFVSVMLICLTAVEHNSSFLLADINPVLYPLIYQSSSKSSLSNSSENTAALPDSTTEDSTEKSVNRTRSFQSDGSRQPKRLNRGRSLQFELDLAASSSSSSSSSTLLTVSAPSSVEAGTSKETEDDFDSALPTLPSSPDSIDTRSVSPLLVAGDGFGATRDESSEVLEDDADEDLDEADADSNDDASSTDTFLNGVTSLSIRGRRRTGSMSNSGSDTLSVHTLVACEDAALEDFKHAFCRSGSADFEETIRETRSESENEASAEEGEQSGRGRSSSSPPPLRSSSLPALCASDHPKVIEADLSEKSRQGSLPYGFSRPKEGQSLLGFLAAQDTCTCAESDKENAHFAICEALIAAFEQMRCNACVDVGDGEGLSIRVTDDPEIKALNMKIEKRKMELERGGGFTQRDGFTDYDTVTTGSPLSSLHSSSAFSDLSSSDYSSEDENSVRSRLRRIDPTHSTPTQSRVPQPQQHRPKPAASAYDSSSSSAFGSAPSSDRISLSQYSSSSLALPTAIKDSSNVSLASWNGSSMADSATFSSSTVSAEVVALNLLRKFSEHQLPKASELEWIVSEEECSQALLPLPDSIAVAPDEVEKGIATRIRGNLEWAPPRQQIVFNVNTPENPKIQIAKQNYRCAGCGAKVETKYAKRLKYCHYLGKFFCTCCHSNEAFVIPARVLHKWDFNKYPVSNFSRDMLIMVYEEPLFNVNDTNPRLYRKFRNLNDIRNMRQSLYRIQKYISTCRFAEKELIKMRGLPNHLYNEIDFYSIQDFIKIKTTDFLKPLKEVFMECNLHTTHCELCLARGHICEICQKGDILFPWTANIYQCGSCHACFHLKCFEKKPSSQRSETVPCPKCYRLGKRKSEISRELSPLSD